MAILDAKLFEHMIKAHNTRSKTPADVVCVGTDDMADQVRKALAIMDLDYHVIVDDELTKRSVIVTSHHDMGEIPNGGRN